MAPDDPPSWISAAIPAAVRLAAEAGTEVDEVLAHPRNDPAAADRLAQHAAVFEHSAGLTEVATDLAGLLWAECEDLPLIATIVEEPAARASLEAVAEARRCAGRRLAEEAAICRTRTAHAPHPPDVQPGSSLSVRWAALRVDTAAPAPAAPAPAPAAPAPAAPAARAASASAAASVPAASVPAASVPAASVPAASVPAAPVLSPAAAPTPQSPAAPAVSRSRVELPVPDRPTRLAVSASGPRRSATGAVVAGAAATAILLFGRHLRRA